MYSPGQVDTSVDSSSRVPLHVQIAGILRDRIQGHTLGPGEPLPTEAELQDLYGVSRSVARQAMTTLVTEGLVTRGRGRGSVVAPERQHHRLVHRAAGLSTQIGATGVSIRTHILSFARDATPAYGTSLGGEIAYRLERQRFIGENAAAYIRTWLPEKYGSKLSAEELENESLHEVLRTRFGVEIVGGARQVRAVAADEELARVLSVRSGAPLLLLEGETRDRSGAIVEVFATWHRGDLITFDLDVDEDRAAVRRPEPLAVERSAHLERAEKLAAELVDELGHLR